MTTFRQGSSIIELARDLMAVMQPATGTRATGRVRIEASSSDVQLPRNWALIPIVNDAAREDLLFKVGQGPNRAEYPNGKRVKVDESEPDAESWWSVTANGTTVDIVSILGGVRHNLPANTRFILDPVPRGVESTATLLETISDGADAVHFGAAKSITQYEQLGPGGDLDLFRSQTGKLPAVVVAWDGSEPADGTTQSSIDRGRTRQGVTRQLFKEQFNIWVVTKRLDSDHLRRNEGTKLLDDLTGLLSDRQSVDGQVFSSPTGIQIRGRQRVLGNNQAYQHLYIYLLSLSVTNVLEPYDDREFSPWLRTNMQVFNCRKDADGNRIRLANEDIPMRRISMPDALSAGSSTVGGTLETV